VVVLGRGDRVRLSGLDTNDNRRKDTSYRVETVKRAILDVSVGDRIHTEAWPIRLDIPFYKTRPDTDGNLAPATTQDRNLDALLSLDGLITITDEYCSAGVGQRALPGRARAVHRLAGSAGLHLATAPARAWSRGRQRPCRYLSLTRRLRAGATQHA
jgi:hypothetical protein